MASPSPAIQLRQLLIEARVEGVTFDEAWVRSVGRVVERDDGTLDLVGGRITWPHDTSHRKEWKMILASFSQREVWRSAYYREAPTRRDAKLSHLSVAA